MRQHRLIYDMPASGSYNMAVDEAILNSVAAGMSLPTLRLYAWTPACLSLGYGQTWTDADLKRIHASGWAIVRRSTGGKAILHVDELTYSLVIPEAHPLAQGSIVESYRRISQALMVAIENLGLQTLAEAKETDAKMTGPVCFEVPSHYEITTPDRRKLVGSAQMRRKGCVLQHGSLPLYGDVARICDALTYENEAEREQAKQKVRGRAATLADALNGTVLVWEVVAEAIVQGFVDVFGLDFMEAGLSLDEQAETHRLTNEVYGTDAWTQRR